jgi:hypothetical protein
MTDFIKTITWLSNVLFLTDKKNTEKYKNRDTWCTVHGHES